MASEKPNLVLSDVSLETAATVEIGGTKYEVPPTLALSLESLDRLDTIVADVQGRIASEPLRAIAPQLIEAIRIFVPALTEEAARRLSPTQVLSAFMWVRGGYQAVAKKIEEAPVEGAGEAGPPAARSSTSPGGAGSPLASSSDAASPERRRSRAAARKPST